VRFVSLLRRNPLAGGRVEYWAPGWMGGSGMLRERGILFLSLGGHGCARVGGGGDGRAPFPWLGRWRNLIGGFRQSLPANGRQQPVVHGGSRPLHDWLLAAARAWPSAGECFLEKNATGRRGWTEHAVPPRYPSTSPRKPLTRSTALAVPPST